MSHVLFQHISDRNCNTSTLILHNGLLSADWTEWVLHKYLHCVPQKTSTFLFFK